MKLLDTDIGKYLNELYKLQLNKEIDSEALIDRIEYYLNEIKNNLKIKYSLQFNTYYKLYSKPREVYYLDTESYEYYKLLKKEAFELQAINSYYLYDFRDIIKSIDYKLSIDSPSNYIYDTEEECYNHYYNHYNNPDYNGYINKQFIKEFYQFSILCIAFLIASPIMYVYNLVSSKKNNMQIH